MIRNTSNEPGVQKWVKPRPSRRQSLGLERQTDKMQLQLLVLQIRNGYIVFIFLPFLQMRHQNRTSQKAALSAKQRFKVASKRPARSNFLPITTSFSSASFPWQELIEGRWCWRITSGNRNYLITSENPQGLMTMLFLWTPNSFWKPSAALSFHCIQTILWRKRDKYSHIHPSDSRGVVLCHGEVSQAHTADCQHSLCLCQLATL